MTHKLTDLEQRVLASLRAHVEGCNETKADGSVWRDVYLDNATLPSVSIRQFDGTLGSLEKKGFYRDCGGDCFGMVRIS